MKRPPVLVPPQQGKPFKLYISADHKTIGSALMQEFEGKEPVVFYLSRRLLDPETRYSPTEKLCLCLYFSCTKLRHYLLSAECTVVSKADVIKHMLSMPILNGRVGKWILMLSEFDLRYESAKAVKGQVIADFVTHHHKPSINCVEPVPWTLFFDGSSCKQGGGIGIVIISPRVVNFEFAFPTEPMITNNQAEYEAVLKGIQLLHEVKAEAIEIFGDSQLIINQLIGLFECKEDTLRGYYDECQRLLKEFPHVSFQHIPRAQNQEANRLA